MFAVVKLGGKQHMAPLNGVIMTEKLEYLVGDKFTISGSDILFYSGNKGEEGLIAGAEQTLPTVEFEVLEQKRNKTIIIFKKKRRKNYRRKNGHRQCITVLRVKEISFV